MSASAAATLAPPDRTRSRSPLAALSFRPFRWWFLSQVTSASGGMTQGVATSWLVLQMTGSAVALGAMAASTMLPSLLFGAWCGGLVDRLDRRRVLIVTQSAQTLLSVLLYALIATGHASYGGIFAINLGTGLSIALDGPARQVYVADLVGRGRLASAVSLYEVILNASRVLGPALGGLLLALVGPGACVLANAASFLAPLAVLILLRPAPAPAAEASPPRPTATPAEHNSGRTAGRNSGRTGGVLAGLRYAWSIPVIRACLLIAAASCLIFNSGVIFPLLAGQAFHLGGGGYGALLSTFGLGALPGALVAARGAEPTGRQVGLLAAATGLVTVATAAAPDVAALFAGTGLLGFCSIWMIARANTLVQLAAAPHLRGRVMGAWVMMLPGAVPVTGLGIGVLADLAGPRVAFAAAGLLMFGIAAASWGSLATPADPGAHRAAQAAAAV